MTAHTPGPWHVYEEAGIDYRPENIYAEVGGESLGAHVAVCMGGGRIRAISKAEERANARLIAAAPDLLEALKKIKSMFSFKEKMGVAGLNAEHCIGEIYKIADAALSRSLKGDGE